MRGVTQSKSSLQWPRPLFDRAQNCVTLRRTLRNSAVKTDGRSYLSGTATRERFTGKERGGEGGWDYFGARYYVPAIGRWLVTDPLAEAYASWSPYNYVLNNPALLIDPTGKYPTCGDDGTTCDDIYQIGSVVENRFGSWEYVGNNEWRPIGLNFSIQTSFLSNLLSKPEASVREWQPGFMDRWSESSNWFASETYSLANTAWMVVQTYSPLNEHVTHLTGALATRGEQRDAFVETAATAVGAGSVRHFMRGTKVWAGRYPSGGGGVVLKGSGGRRIISFDWHPIRLGGKKTGQLHNLPHVDVPGRAKHWPWHQINKWWRGVK